MSELTRRLRQAWVGVVRRGWNRVPGVRRLAQWAKQVLYAVEYRGRDFVTLPDGIRIYLRDDPSNFIKYDYLDLMACERWQPLMVRLMRERLRPGMNVLDVGAAFGYLSLVAARQVGPEGHVFAFEPEDVAFRNLVKNIELNGQANVTAVRAAVSDAACEAVTLFGVPCGASLMKGTSDLTGAGMLCQAPVPGITVDEYLAERGWPPIHLVKIDIEGGEVLAFRGMRETLRRNAHVCVMAEFSAPMLAASGFSPDDYFGELGRLGFDRFWDITGDEPRPVDPASEPRLRGTESTGRPLDAMDILAERAR